MKILFERCWKVLLFVGVWLESLEDNGIKFNGVILMVIFLFVCCSGVECSYGR